MAAFDAEQVTVRNTADGLEIHVRSRVLDAKESLRCALEVARRLTGRPESLRLLVLNGSSIYAATPDEPTASVRAIDLRC